MTSTAVYWNLRTIRSFKSGISSEILYSLQNLKISRLSVSSNPVFPLKYFFQKLNLRILGSAFSLNLEPQDKLYIQTILFTFRLLEPQDQQNPRILRSVLSTNPKCLVKNYCNRRNRISRPPVFQTQRFKGNIIFNCRILKISRPLNLELYAKQFLQL